MIISPRSCTQSTNRAPQTDASFPGATTIEVALTGYIKSKDVADSGGRGGGNYVSNAESVIRHWANWLEREESVESLDAIAPVHLRCYARHLKTKVRQDEYAASTASTYYAYVQAFLTWCSRDQLLDSNPAEDEIALEELLDDPGMRETQQPENCHTGNYQTHWLPRHSASSIGVP